MYNLRMRYMLRQHWLGLLCSILSILTFWLMGYKTVWGPGIGIITQLAWVWFVFAKKQWGLFPASVIILGVNIRNFFLWM